MPAPINRATPAGTDMAPKSAAEKPPAAAFDTVVAKAKASDPSPPSPSPAPPTLGGDPRPLPGPGERGEQITQPRQQPPVGTVIERGTVENVLVKAWNSPNTALGLVEGGLGYVIGMGRYALGHTNKKPGVSVGNNAIQFTGNPLGGDDRSDTGGAIANTLGNVIIYKTNPNDLSGGELHGNVGDHERQHTYQGEALGPFLVPAYYVGGIVAEMRERGSFSSEKNFLETGPYSSPPRPWP